MSVNKIPSLKLLAGFEAAARHGNFSRAADELNISQSAISHQVQQLEQQLQQPLFRRVGRGVELNVGGEVLLQTVQRALTVLRSGLGQIATYLDPGLVVLVCPEHIAHGWLQNRLDALQAALPDLCLLVSTDISARFVDEVDVDIHIGARPLQQSGLTESGWLQEEWLVLAASPLADALKAIPCHQQHLHAELHCLEQSLTDQATATLFLNQLSAFRKRAIYDDARLLLDAVLRGRGIACLPNLLAAEALADGRLQALPGYPRTPGTAWWISGAVEQARAPIVREVFHWLQQEAQRSRVSI